MSVNQFRQDNLPVIVDIANRAWKEIRKMTRVSLGDEIADLLNPEGESMTKGRQIEEFAATNPDKILVCERNGRIVGFVTFSMNTHAAVPIGVIGNNAADPDCGEKGVGQEMYQAVFEQMKKCKMKAVRVTTGLDHAHAPARKAYLRAGFDRELLSVTYYRKLDS